MGDIGAFYLASLGFSQEVCEATRLHVSAKRALVSTEPSYMQHLSDASKATLVEQGGPMDQQELAAFLCKPGAHLALRLRRYDDKGKVAGSPSPQLEHFKQRLLDHLLAQSAAS